MLILQKKLQINAANTGLFAQLNGSTSVTKNSESLLYRYADIDRSSNDINIMEVCNHRLKKYKYPRLLKG